MLIGYCQYCHLNSSPINELWEGALDMVEPRKLLANAKVSTAILTAETSRHRHTDGVSGILTNPNTYQIQMLIL